MTKTNKIIAGIGIFLLSGFAIGKMVMQSDTQNKLNITDDSEVVVHEQARSEQETSTILDNHTGSNDLQTIQSPNTKGFIGYFNDKPLDNPIDNIFHLNIEGELQGNETVWLEYELYGVEDYTGIAHSINDQLSVGGYMVKKSKEWKKQREQLHPSVLKQGDNVVRFTLPEDSDYGYIVRNLSMTIEPFNETNTIAKSDRRLIVNQPTTEYYYGNLGYLQGYVVGEDADEAEVLIDGEPIRYNKGSFESLVKKHNSEENWTVKIQAIFNDGQVLTTEVPFNKPTKWDKQNGFNKDIHYAEQTIKEKDALDISLAKVRLKADSGAVSKETNVSITALRERDIPALDAGMVNVTYGANGEAGYRFLPHGTKFAKDVSVEMAYDTTKIPNGYGVNDIKTYFFDEQKHRWVAIHRDTVLLASHTTVSRTNHFSDYINAIIKVPESPETQGYTPTSMKDVKAANPATGINLIQPPSANSMGNANLSYPINIPAGRQGMQPKLGISYSSGGGNGWLGLGWDLSVPSISVETRWGVPHYNPDKESETYLMGGEQLLPLAHRSEWADRSSEKQFFPRVEGSFSIIKRHGDKPSNYWWEVTDKSGVIYYYGGSSTSNGVIKDAVLTDDSGNIAHWSLVEIRDLNSNYMKYNYAIVDDKATSEDLVEGTNIYLKSITYTGYKNDEGKYSVKFIRDRDLGEKRREDIVLNARYGFPQINVDLLRKIEVNFGDKKVRSYEMIYKEGAFKKTLLKHIVEYDALGNEFSKHDLNYYDDVRNDDGEYVPFVDENNVESWESIDDKIKGDFIGPDFNGFRDKPSAISGTKSTDKGAGLAVTVGVAFAPMKLASAGGSYDYAQSESEGVLAMVDLNGDALPDKLMVIGNAMWYRPQLPKESEGDFRFGDKVEIKGTNKFLKESSKTNTFGFEVNFGAFVGVNKSKTKSKTSVYFSDVNGDGLIDIVNNGKVWYNHINAEGVPEFSKSSEDTPNIITSTGSVNSEILPEEEDTRDEDIMRNPLHDVVRYFRVPYNGTIDIFGNPRLIEDNSIERQAYETADGVRMTIQLNEKELWVDSVEADYYDALELKNVTGLKVNKGDRIYFRVQSKLDGAFDHVSWNPEIIYRNQPESTINANNKPVYDFKASEDFVLSGRQYVTAPIDGHIKIDGVFSKPITSDDVKVEILLIEEDEISKTLFQKEYKWDDVIEEESIEYEKDVEENTTLLFRVYSDTNVDWPSISWFPRLYYSESHNENFENVYDSNGNPIIEFVSVPQFAMYNNVKNLSEVKEIQSLCDTLTIKPLMEFDKTIDDHLTFTIKKVGSLVHKQEIEIKDTLVVDSILVVARKGEQLFFEFHTPNIKLAKHIKSCKVHVTDSLGTEIISAGLNTVIEEEDEIYGHLYRNWGNFGYNGNLHRAYLPIIEDSLVLNEAIKNAPEDMAFDENETDPDKLEESYNEQGGYKPYEDMFIVLIPVAGEGVLMGYEEQVFIGANDVRSSRMGEDDVAVRKETDSSFSEVRGIIKKSYTESTATTLGAGVGPVSISNCNTNGENYILNDFMDMNGDRYPDVVSENRIQYTGHMGGLSEDYITHNMGKVQKNKTKANTKSFGGSYAISVQEAGSNNKSAKTSISVAPSLGGNLGSGTNYAEYSWKDINGDGLPDRISHGGKVYLNMGYDFKEAQNWNFEYIQEGSSKNKGASGGLGFNVGQTSISGGIGLSKSENRVEHTLADVNGDGLVDVVYATSPMKVRFNTGYGFDDVMYDWNNGNNISKSSSISESANVAFTASIRIWWIKICINPKVHGGFGFSREEEQLNDVDGDGYLDFVRSTKENVTNVKKSTIARTNLLQEIKRPLGGNIILDYQPVGNTYEMPQAIWTLSKVTMDDGHKGDGVDKIQTSFVYNNGYHDRYERAFYGFGEVKTNQLDESGDTYRSTTRTFANGNYFEKGLLLNETIEDSKGNKYVETINEYELKDRNMVNLTNGAEKASSTIAFPALVKTTKKFYEGKSEAQKSTYTTFEYGSYGNVRKYVDYGDTSAEDDISAIIDYHEVTDKNILSVPKSITVTGSGKTLRQRSTLIDDATGKITKIIQKADKTDAIYDLYYDNYGNLDSIVRPANYKGERMYFAYDYDNTVHSYVTAVRDAYGYSSSTTYDYKFGQVMSTTDINGKQTVYQIDDLGRITDITGPYELESGKDYTIRFKYFPNDAIPWAQTLHYDPEHPENPIETAIFIDGLGRVLQTKKDGAIFEGKNTEDKEVMLVSGKVEYDAFGRSIASYYPVSEDKGNIGTFNTNVDKVKPTTVEYDALDRALITTLPDGAKTETLYGFGEDSDGNSQFMTRVTDANGIITESFTDVKGRQTAVKAPGDIWTSFVYNAINELVSVTDAEDNTTVSTYDMLGRRLSRLHPDAGLTEYTYDASGNMLTQMTANLRENKKPITYEYEYNRLTNISYPENTVNNVRFEYGEAGAQHNRAGRIAVQEDATGAQEFFYGNLGEITKNIRTIIVPDDGVYTFETEWEYDTWNRLKKMTYPDGEELTYEYNTGGLLRSMYGSKKGHVYDYLTQIGYDKFEDRAYITYGNGTETTYEYEADRRRLHNIVASTSSGRAMMDNTYTYDAVNNITKLKSVAPIPAENKKGGNFEYDYVYDDLYRLTNASGTYQNISHQHRYTMDMQYSETGRILHKNQVHQRKEYDETTWGSRHKTTYELDYKYEGDQPHAPSQIGENTYTYDANGNTTGWQSTKNNRRDILWDEENRIRALADNGTTHHYMYDASGERVIKSTGDGQAIYINGFPMGGSGTVGNYTMYVNPYMVVTNMKFTKHFYIEGQRIVSKLGEMGEYQYLLNPKDTLAGGGTIDFGLKGKELKEAIYANFEALGLDGAVFTAGKSGKVPYGKLKKYYRNQDLVNAGVGNTNQPDYNEEPSNKVENLQFYYHTDHLGSSSYITDVSGEVYQHMEYFPFGETFIEERTDAEYTSYLYNGKELDEETGLYYYGARYYDPRISMWYGVDPMAESYPGISSYAYTNNNPINFIDNKGEYPIFIHGTFSDPTTFSQSFIDAMIRSTGWEEYSGYNFASFQWSGENSVKGRDIAANELIKFLKSDEYTNSLKESGLEKYTTLISHSHGGNVAKIVKNQLEKEGWIVDIVNIETPQRGDFQQNKTGNGVNLNFYSNEDLVQFIGSFSPYPMINSRKDPYSKNIEIPDNENRGMNAFQWITDALGHSLHNNEFSSDVIIFETEKAFKECYNDF